MDFIIFEIKGKFAHFRKFYTNSSSLSYTVPPRTTIEGIIAAILGYERDSYYDLFSVEKLNLAVKKISSTKKIIQSLNYIKATSSGEIINPNTHTQIPFEILTGNEGVAFRVYVNHIDSEIMHQFEDRIKNNKCFYTPYLGSAPFNCNINYIGRYEALEGSSNDYIDINTIIRQNLVVENGIKITGMNLNLVKEKMPRDFYEGRNIKEVTDYIFDEDGLPLNVKLNGSYYTVNNENIVLL